MGDVINLKRVKKKLEREQALKRAEQNRARHGRTKAERERDAATEIRLREKLDQHRIGEEDR